MILRALPAALMAAILAFAAPALAAPEDRQAAPPAESAGAQPDDRELSEFVAAFVRLIGVQHGYMMMAQQEEDPAALEQMKAQAVVDMTQAIERDGLSLDRYNQIAVAVRDDPQLQGKVESMLQQLASDPDATGE